MYDKHILWYTAKNHSLFEVSENMMQQCYGGNILFLIVKNIEPESARKQGATMPNNIQNNEQYCPYNTVIPSFQQLLIVTWRHVLVLLDLMLHYLYRFYATQIFYRKTLANPVISLVKVCNCKQLIFKVNHNLIFFY